MYDSPAAEPAQKRQVRAWVEAAVREKPGETLLKARLADMASYAGNLAEGISGFRQVLASNPDDVGVLNNLAWALALNEEPHTEEALRLINHAIDVQGSHPSLLDTRAVILIRAGRLDEAIGDIQAATGMATQSPTLPQSLSIHLAWAHQGKGQLAEARLSRKRRPEATSWKRAIPGSGASSPSCGRRWVWRRGRLHREASDARGKGPSKDARGSS